MARERTTGEPDPAALKEILRRIVEVGEPERVVMFGSAARGDMGPNSDIDLLVVKAGDYHRVTAHRGHLHEPVRNRAGQ